jgi:hypothetical protein
MFLVAQHSQNEKFCYRVIVATQKLYELLPQEKAQSQQPTLGHPHRLINIPQRIFCHHPIFRPTQQYPNRRLIIRMAQQIVHRRQIEIQLPCILWFEFIHFQFNHHIAAQFEMIKQQIQAKILTAYLQWKLFAYERKTRSQLQQKLLDMLNQSILKFSLLGFCSQAEKVEQIWVFQSCSHKIGAIWR